MLLMHSVTLSRVTCFNYIDYNVYIVHCRSTQTQLHCVQTEDKCSDRVQKLYCLIGEDSKPGNEVKSVE